jgi:alpha-galactosidase
MSDVDSILRLQSATVDVVIKTQPFAEIIYWGPHLATFRRRMLTRLLARSPTAP